MDLVGQEDGGEEHGDCAGGDLPQDRSGVKARVDAGDPRAPGVGSVQEQGVGSPGDLVRDARVGTHATGMQV